MLLDQRERVDAVLSLADQVDLLNALEQEGQLVARGLFVVDNDDVDGHSLKSLRPLSIFSIAGRLAAGNQHRLFIC